MKIIMFTISVISIIASLPFAFASNYNVELAVEFSRELSKKSPTDHEGLPLRVYQFEDMNYDGKLEVLEISNQIEENSVGLLNVEIAPAFEWITIYSYKNGNYVESTANFNWFLQHRKIHYKLWLKLIKNPLQLNKDSQELIKLNKPLLLKTLKSYFKNIRKMTNA